MYNITDSKSKDFLQKKFVYKLQTAPINGWQKKVQSIHFGYELIIMDLLSQSSLNKFSDIHNFQQDKIN